jgi:hypothetical protein
VSRRSKKLMQPSGSKQRMASGCRPRRHLNAWVELGEASSWACCRFGVLQCRWECAQDGSLASETVLPLYAVPALVVAMTTVDVVTEGLWQLRLLGPDVGRIHFGQFLPDSEAVLSPPAISRRLEMEGREGFFSAGGEGGDWGCSRWYGYGCACRVYGFGGPLGTVYPRGSVCW